MKTLKRIEIVAVLLFVAIIIFASFFGVYKKEDFRVVNIIKEYDLGMQFTDARVLKMTVSTAEIERIYNSEGNIIEDDGETEYTEENGYRTETVKVNEDEVLTIDNYKLVKKILKNRLKGMTVGEYNIELNEETGDLSIELQENDEVEETIHHLTQQGKFTIIDDETKETLLDNSDVKSATVVYGASDETGTSTTIYLQINFNDEGAEKLEEISKVYVKTTEEQENEEGEIEEVDTTKYISVVLDGETLNSTYFGETMSTGVLYIPMSEATDNKTLTQAVHEINHITTIINNGELPIEYEYSEETVGAENTIDTMLIIKVLIPAVLLLLICVVKFGVKGFVSVFLQIGYVAMLLLVLRYTNVVITIEGILGIIFSGILNYILVCAMLNNLKKKGHIEWKLIGKFALRTILVYILAIILSFNSLTRVSSLGMTLVWGSFVLYIYNLTITRYVLKMLNK